MSTNYEDFNPNDPYAESNEFKPAFCLDFKKGEVWFGGGKVHFAKDGSGYLANKNIIFKTNGDILSNQFDQAYTLATSDIYLPQVPEGYTKTIKLPYYILRPSAAPLRVHGANSSDIFYYKLNDGVHQNLKGLVEYYIQNVGAGILEFIGVVKDEGHPTCMWIINDINIGQPKIID